MRLKNKGKDRMVRGSGRERTCRSWSESLWFGGTLTVLGVAFGRVVEFGATGVKLQQTSQVIFLSCVLLWRSG